jgi:hypothetical protein
LRLASSSRGLPLLRLAAIFLVAAIRFLSVLRTLFGLWAVILLGRLVLLVLALLPGLLFLASCRLLVGLFFGVVALLLLPVWSKAL